MIFLLLCPTYRIGGSDRECGTDMYTLLYLKWIVNKDLLHSTENSALCYMATHSSILAWRIPWTEEPGRLQPMGPQRVRHD